MRKFLLHIAFLLVVPEAIAEATLIAQLQNEPESKSEWVYPDAKGKLVYKTLPAGDRIMDFSYAGYMGGGVRIPDVPAKITLSAKPGDNSEAIQKAIDEVSAMKLVNGFRGAVVLQAGSYDCEKTITINASGVVLRGAGSGANGTILNLTGKAHACITARGRAVTKTIGDSTIIADKYVAAGSYGFSVKNAAGFKVGDTIRITRFITPEWVQLMGMDKLVRNGNKQTWISGDIETERVIRKIEKYRITIDVPLNDSYDSKYTGDVSVKKISSTGQLNQVGIENFRIVAPAQSVTINEGHHRAFTMAGLTDGWARNIGIFNTVNSVSVTGKRITVDNISIIHDVPTVGAAKPADLNGSGYQLLFNRCYIKGDNLFFFGTGAKVTGPVVVLNSVFRGNGWIQPHQRWATGLLIDGCEVPDGGIDFMNRGIMGSGHGWTIGWAVAWNCKAKSYLNQMPPGSANWVIGSLGQHQFRAIPFDTVPYLPEGIYDSHNKPVTPASLYLAQLQERLGKQALVNIGYGNKELNSTTDLNNWPTGASPKEIGKRVADRFVATPHTNFNRPTPPRSITYPETCTWYGSLTFAKETGDKKLVERLVQRFEPLFGSRDTLIPKPDHVDHTVFGAVPLELYMQTKDRRYLYLGKNMANKQWGAPEGPRVKPESFEYYKKGLTWQTRMWIDDMFMITAVQAQAYRATNNAAFINRAAKEMVVYLDSLQKPNGLFYHAPDVPFFWARGNGWMAVGMSELLRSLPKNNPDFQRIRTGYRLMMSSLLQYQAENGMWRQLIDDPSSWAETSATGMFTFAFITGVKNGWLDKKTYAPAARKAWLQLITYLDDNADISEVCEGTNKKNDRQYYLDRKRNIGDLHGQAPILWCATALLRK